MLYTIAILSPGMPDVATAEWEGTVLLLDSVVKGVVEASPVGTVAIAYEGRPADAVMRADLALAQASV